MHRIERCAYSNAQLLLPCHGTFTMRLHAACTARWLKIGSQPGKRQPQRQCLKAHQAMPIPIARQLAGDDSPRARDDSIISTETQSTARRLAWKCYGQGCDPAQPFHKTHTAAPAPPNACLNRYTLLGQQGSLGRHAR